MALGEQDTVVIGTSLYGLDGSLKWSIPPINGTLVAALSDGGAAFRAYSLDPSVPGQNIVRFDANGVQTSDQWGTTNGSGGFGVVTGATHIGNGLWAGQIGTSAAMIQGDDLRWASAVWPFGDGGNSQGQGHNEEYAQLVDCQKPSPECQQRGWTQATGGPNEWIFNGLKSLLTLLNTPCDRTSKDLWVRQACNIDDYVFSLCTSPNAPANCVAMKDANSNLATRQGFAAYLAGQSPLNTEYPSFYDGTKSYLEQCGWTKPDQNCTSLAQHDDFTGNDATDASTIIFDHWKPPSIPHVRTFFRPAFIYRELLGVPEPNNMALIFHESLHSYTRLGDIELFKPNDLKRVLGCDRNWSGTYDITKYLIQFTTQQLLPNPKGCQTFSGNVPGPDPPQ
jgi:hypothetical protein